MDISVYYQTPIITQDSPQQPLKQLPDGVSLSLIVQRDSGHTWLLNLMTVTLQQAGVLQN